MVQKGGCRFAAPLYQSWFLSLVCFLRAWPRPRRSSASKRSYLSVKFCEFNFVNIVTLFSKSLPGDGDVLVQRAGCTVRPQSQRRDPFMGFDLFSPLL